MDVPFPGPSTQVFDEKTLPVVRDGGLEAMTGHDRSVCLAADEGLLVPRHRLPGPRSVTETGTADLFPDRPVEPAPTAVAGPVAVWPA